MDSTDEAQGQQQHSDLHDSNGCLSGHSTIPQLATSALMGTAIQPLDMQPSYSTSGNSNILFTTPVADITCAADVLPVPLPMDPFMPVPADLSANGSIDGSVHSSQYGFASRDHKGCIPGAPRVFMRTCQARTGLETGDVVLLLHKGRPYRVAVDELPFKETPTQYVLQLSDDVLAEEDGSCYLEVVRQGSFVGFRSAAAGQRFMQPRRKAPHRLVFFNLNCGIWEHWEAQLEDAEQPWSQQAVSFRSRRLAQVELQVEVKRVGTYLNNTHSYITPRTLPIIPETLSEDEHLRRMSALLVQEWFKFVDVEKHQRQLIEADLSILMEEAKELRTTTIRQVEYLRSEMNSEMLKLFHAVKARDAAVLSLRQRLRHTLETSTAILVARKNHECLRAVVASWWDLVVERVYYKAAIMRLTQRLRHRYLQHAWEFWVETVTCRAWRVRMLQRGLQNVSLRRLEAAMQAWHKSTQRAARMRSLQLRLTGRVFGIRLCSSWQAWQALISQRQSACSILTELAARRRHSLLMRAWNSWQQLQKLSLWQQLQASYVHTRHIATHSAVLLHAWQAQVQAKQHRRLQTSQLQDKRMRQQQQTCLLQWYVQVQHNQEQRSVLLRCIARRHQAVCCRCFLAWLDQASSNLHLQRLAGQQAGRRQARWLQALMHGWQYGVRQAARHTHLLHQVRLLLLSKITKSWQEVALLRRWQGARVRSALMRTANIRLNVAWTVWRQHTVQQHSKVHIAERMAGRQARLCVRAAIQTWQQYVMRRQQAMRLLRLTVKRWQGSTLARALVQWHYLTCQHTAHLDQAIRSLCYRTRLSLTQILGRCWAGCAVPLAEGCLPVPCVPPQPQLSPGAGGFVRSQVSWIESSSTTSSPTAVAVQLSPFAEPELETPADIDALLMRELQRWQWLVCLCFRHWKALASRRGRLKQALAAHLASAVHRHCDHLLQAWHATAVEAKRNKRLAAILVRRVCFATVAKALLAWQQLAEQRAASLRRLMAHLVCRNGACQRWCMLWWAAWSHRRVVARCRSARLLMLLQQRHLYSCLHVWQAQAEAAAERCQRAQQLARKLMLSQERQVLAAWSLHVQMGQQHARRATRHRRRRMLATMFTAWRGKSEYSCYRACAAEAFAKDTHRRRLLRGWLQAVSVHTHSSSGSMELRLGRAELWWQRRTARSTLTAWHFCARQRKVLRRVHGTLVRRMHAARHRVILAGWCHMVAQGKQFRSMLRQLQTRRAAQIRQAVLHEWLQLADSKYAARVHSEHLHTNYCQGLLARCWIAWCQARMVRQAGRAALLRVRARWQRQLLQQAFTQWQLLTATCRQRRVLGMRISHYHKQSVLSSTLRQWQAVARTGKRLRHACAVVASTSERTYLHWAYNQWRVHAQMLAACHLACDAINTRRRKQLQRHILVSWMAAAQRLRAQLLSWLAWVHERKLYAVVTERVKGRCRRNTLTFYTHLWLEQVLTRHAALDRLKTCVKRKKIAFQLFKQWYWEAFDDDVQDTIRRMFHTTDTAARSVQPSQEIGLDSSPAWSSPAYDPIEAAMHQFVLPANALGQSATDRLPTHALSRPTRSKTTPAARVYGNATAAMLAASHLAPGHTAAHLQPSDSLRGWLHTADTPWPADVGSRVQEPRASGRISSPSKRAADNHVATPAQHRVSAEAYCTSPEQSSPRSQIKQSVSGMPGYYNHANYGAFTRQGRRTSQSSLLSVQAGQGFPFAPSLYSYTDDDQTLQHCMETDMLAPMKLHNDSDVNTPLSSAAFENTLHTSHTILRHSPPATRHGATYVVSGQHSSSNIPLHRNPSFGPGSGLSSATFGPPSVPRWRQVTSNQLFDETGTSCLGDGSHQSFEAQHAALQHNIAYQHDHSVHDGVLSDDGNE